MFLTDSLDDANKARKWSTQSREDAAWYQHEELGYNYRMSNIIAGVVRGQLPYLEEHIAQKKVIYERYREGLKDLPVKMNPVDFANSEPNYWLSCLILDEEAMCPTVRGEKTALYRSEPGRSCPTEILEALAAFNAEGRPIWKPMHLQPVYASNGFVKATDGPSVSRRVYESGLCLPSDIKNTEEDMAKIIGIVRGCFRK
jgi:dTDP-4-amino-4,6-dideoxygalactose transaminase